MSRSDLAEFAAIFNKCAHNCMALHGMFGDIAGVLRKNEFAALLKKIDGKHAMNTKQLTETFGALCSEEPHPIVKELVVDYSTFETW